jgi:hypothetical protein
MNPVALPDPDYAVVASRAPAATMAVRYGASSRNAPGPNGYQFQYSV